MRDFLRFFLSSTDQSRIDPASLTVTDLPSNDPSGAYQALRIGFTVTNPGAGPPQLRPVFPGSLLYRADDGAPGDLPEPGGVVVTPAGYSTWRTRGTLRIKVKDTVVEAGIRQHVQLSRFIPMLHGILQYN